MLFDFFEFVYWLSIIDTDQFDIIRVRDISKLGKSLKYEYLLLFIGLHVKVHLNVWKQPHAIVYSNVATKGSEFLNIMLGTLASPIYH